MTVDEDVTYNDCECNSSIKCLYNGELRLYSPHKLGSVLSRDLAEILDARQDKLRDNKLRDNKLVTIGTRAAYMDSKGLIVLPGGSCGEDELTLFARTIVDEYSKIDDISFDEYIESELLKQYGPRKTDLKPCPFCGGKVELYSDRICFDREDYWIACEECGCKQARSISKEAVIEAWNKRV